MKNKNKGIFIVISGPSGAGKGTICKELMKVSNNLWLSVSMTTREPRVGETNGVEYFFVSKEEFRKNIEDGNLLEYAVIHSGHYYGTPKASINKYLNEGIDVILEIDINGALQIKENNKEALFIFILPPSMKELKNRLITRGTESEDKIIERFKRGYQEINEITKYNYVVVNDDLDKAVDKVKAIIMAERCRVDRIEEVFLNNQEEVIHEELISNKSFYNQDIIID
ncbi:MAG: guanylate kinase [Bacilli bacterium]|nr:guanylate kinase [Bacilli bacterium]